MLGVALASALAGAGAPGAVSAQTESALAERADSVASRLNCPICQGYTLRDCPLPICAQMRDEIRQMLDEGIDESEVIEHYVALHGPQVLNMPPARGPFLAAWILPVAVLAGGAVAVARALAGASRGLGRPSTPQGPNAAPGAHRHPNGDEAATSMPMPEDAQPAPVPEDAETVERLERLLRERDAR